MARLVLFLCHFAVSFAAATGTLLMVNVLYRHGDRSPVTVYPKDPHQESAWPNGLGWLSEIGMRQQFALGQFLRTEYGSFLNSTYKNTEIVVESSNVDRCLMSAYCNLAGLYPPNEMQMWNRNISWQPIPVHTRPEQEDNKLALEMPCAHYDELYAQELHSPAVQEEERVNADFYKLMDNETGVKRENISEIWKVADTLFCEKAHNYSLPSWTNQTWKNGTVFSKLMSLRDWGFGLQYNGSELSRLKGGPLLKEFIQNMQNVASQPNKAHYKMYMYSAHDSTVAAVTSAMKVYNKRAPPYAAAVLVELHQVDGNYCVKIRYRNGTGELHNLSHPDCQKECCPLDTFVDVTKDMVPNDWAAECTKTHAASEHDYLLGTLIAFAVLFGVTLIFLLVVLYAYCRQHRVTKTFESLP